MSTSIRSDRPQVVTTPSQPSPEPQGRLVRSKARPGLTSTGVAILGASVAVVASIIAELLTDGLGWLFAVPFVLVCVYCAAEVSRGAMRSAIVMPPLAILLVSAVNPIWSGNVPGPRGWMVKTLTTLTTLAPTLMVATALAAAIVGVRYWRANRL